MIVARLALAGSHFHDAVARRHLAPRRAGRAARAGRASSRRRRRARALARRRGLPLDLQPHRALPRRRRRERALATLEELAGEPLAASLYRLHDEAAALHLFRVAAGLDSLVPGEGEILGQVRAAYEAATPGPALDRVFRQALAVGKRVRTRDGDRREPRVGLVGGRRARRAGLRRPRRAACAARRRRPDRRARGGEPRLARRRDRLRREPDGRGGARARRSLRRRGARRSTSSASDSARSTSSSPRRARPARAARGGRAREAPQRRSSSSTSPCRATSTRRSHELDGCFLYDIDDLEAVVAETLAGRRAEAERAEQLVAEEAERFREWHASLDVVPAIASLRARAEEIRSAELAKLQGRSRTTSGARSSR